MSWQCTPSCSRHKLIKRMDVGRDVRNDFFELHFVSDLK
jgi:hypothetical protein